MAAGIPLFGAKLRVVDGSGATIVSGLSVAADGSYGPIPLIGKSPFRLEACGMVGERFRCVHGLTQTGGATQLTPLGTAVMVLASSQLPEDLLTGTVGGLDSINIAKAQTQLRNAIAPALLDAGMSSNADLLSDALIPASRQGYDRLLDGLAITIAKDVKPYVQISPRLGSGNVYLEPGTTQGQIAVPAQLASTDLSGIDTFARAMTAALKSSGDCSGGIADLMASDARFTPEGSVALVGGPQVASGMCAFFNGFFSNGPALWGYTMPSPDLLSCDLGGSMPLCRIKLLLRAESGQAKNLGEVLLRKEGDSWRFVGEPTTLNVRTDTAVLLQRRVDGATVVDSYSRSLGLFIPVQIGLNCVRVTQLDQSGLNQTLAFFKPLPAATWMSLLRMDADDGPAAVVLGQGTARVNDDVWIPLATGSSGDDIARNVMRAGPTLTLLFYSNAGCTTPYIPSGFTLPGMRINLPATPPLDVQLPTLPWPSLSTASRIVLSALTSAANAPIKLNLTWTQAAASLGLESLSLCGPAGCAAAKLGSVALSGAATSASLAATAGSSGLVANQMKTLRLSGRSGDGLLMTVDFQSCTQQTAGQSCH